MVKKGFLLVGIGLLLLGGIGALWAYKNRPHYAVIPVYYHPSSEIPLVEVEIESRKYQMSLGSGSMDYISLQKRALDQLREKKIKETHFISDIQGNSYECPYFLIPKIKISNFIASPIFVKQEDAEICNSRRVECEHLREPFSIQQKRTPQRAEFEDGAIGMKLFERFCLYLDLPHDEIYIAENEAALKKKKGFSLEGFVEVPLSSRKNWALLIVETEQGEKKLLLNTGSECSLWNDPSAKPFSPLTIDNLKLSGVDFGSQEFRTFKIPDYFGVDGMLGIDFIKKHPIFIDLKNKRVCIGNLPKEEL